jgi:hypothetical protein
VSARPRLAVLVVLLAALAALPSVANASPPLNDNFASAISISPGDVVSGSNIGATSEAGEPNTNEGNPKEQRCALVTDGPLCTSSVWYSIVAPADGQYTVDTCDQGTDVDTIVSVFSGDTLGGATQLASNDDGTGTPCIGAGSHYGSRVTFTGTSGTTYHVEVTGFDAAEGSFYLRAYPAASPPPSGALDTQIARDHSLPARRLELFDGQIASGPRATASFDFYADTGHPGATFQCSLDGAAFATCSSPVSYDGLSGGSHTFAVRSVAGGDSDSTPAVQRFTVDNTPPDSFLADGPPPSTSDPFAEWKMSSTERNHLETFQCAIDSQPGDTFCDDYRAGGNSFCTGTHQLRFAAIDRAFNIDPTPVTTSVEETGGAACAAPTVEAPTVSTPSATGASIHVLYNPHGSGGTVHLEYGTSTAYGLHSENQAVFPDDSGETFNLSLLKPGTEYHVKATLTTPADTASSSDVTFTTATLPALHPDIALGTPVAIGNHAAAIPVTISNPGPDNVVYGIQIDAGPLLLTSPVIVGDDEVAPAAGPVSRTVDVVDLKPGTYNVRALVGGDDTLESPTQATLTVPAVPPAGGSAGPAPAPQTPAPPRFALKRNAVKLGKLTRHSRFLTLSISGLPPSSIVTADLGANVKAAALKRLAHGRVKANSRGVAKLKIKLSKKARRALRNRKVKSLTLRITVAPRGQKPTRVTLHPKLKR